MSKVSGSIRKLTLDGVSFDILADANLTETLGKYENEMVPTSGEAILKKTKRVQEVEGVVVSCDGGERDLLIELSERTKEFMMSYEIANGDIIRGLGHIALESRETESLKASLKLLPLNGWSSFLKG